jgi:hypothetical protein
MNDYDPLDEPGEPFEHDFQAPDGTWHHVSAPQTKRDNCADVAAEAGGLDKVTDADLAKRKLTRDEFNAFRMDHVKALEQIETNRQFDKLMIRGFSTPAGRDEHIRELKRLRPDDWQKYLPPE